jgi:hypothetical protein
MSAIVFFGDLPETPNWALLPPASFQLVHDSEFPALGPAAGKHSCKPMTVATLKRSVAQQKQNQPPQPAPLSPEQIHRALVIDESVRAIQLALTNPNPKHVDPKSQRSATVCNLQSRMQHTRSSNGSSFTSDVCVLPKNLDISKMGDWSALAAEVSVQLHIALAKQLGRDDFTVCARFGRERQSVCGGKQRHSVTATVAW